MSKFISHERYLELLKKHERKDTILYYVEGSKNLILIKINPSKDDNLEQLKEEVRAKMDNALNLLKSHINPYVVSEVIGLPLENVMQLKQNLE